MTSDQDLKHPGLQKRGNVFYSRISIPLDLRGAVPVKETLRKSLKTGDRGCALALHHEFQAECRRYFEDVRAKRRDPADLPADLRSKGLDVDALELAALQAIDAQISAWETRGRVALAGLTSAEAVEDYANNIEAHCDAQTEALDLSTETFRRAQTEFLGASRMTAAQVPASQRQHIEARARDAAHLKLAVQAECLTDPDSRIRPLGRFRDSLAHRIRSLSRSVEGRAPTASLTLLDALRHWKGNPKKAQGPAPSASAQRKAGHALRLLAQFVLGLEDVPSEEELSQVRVAEIDEVQAHSFRSWLERQSGAPKTKSDKLNDVKTVFAAVARPPAKDLLGPNWANPWQSVPGISFDNVGSRESFSPSELERIFSQPIFQALDGAILETLEDKTAADRFAFYWIPILALFTGSRVSELCQLEVADIAPAEDHGTGELVSAMYHRIQQIKGSPDRPEKTLKTGAARRIVPLARRVLDLGFLDFVEDVRAAGHLVLFPKLKRGSERAGDRFGGLFRSYAKTLGFKDSLEGLHAFRHTLNGRMSAAGANERHIDYLTGHSDSGNVQTRYRNLQNNPAALRASLDLADFPTVKLPRLYQRGMAAYPPPSKISP